MITEEVFYPVSPDVIEHTDSNLSTNLGSTVLIHKEGNGMPSLENAKVALIGVPEYRGSVNKDHTGCNYNELRSKFYLLKKHRVDIKIVDLGDIRPGNTLADTYHLITSIAQELIENSIVPIFFGGSQDLSLPIYNAFANLKQVINIVNIDSRFDLGEPEQPVDSISWIGQIVMQKPNYLFNYSNLGYQSYFVGNEGVNMMHKLFFDAWRLGEIRNDITEIEPVIRAADMVTTDLSSIRQSDAPGTSNPSPNGFSGEEICQSMMYSGLSDRVSAIGLFEFDQDHDRNGQTAHLTAQMIWYLIEGLSLRRNEFPGKEQSGYTRYFVTIPERKEEMVFLKNLVSGRWWIELPLEGKNHRFNRHNYLPCSLKDYQQACKNEVPERWWQAIHKMY